MVHPEIVAKARELMGRYVKDAWRASPYSAMELAQRAGISIHTLYDIFQGHEGYTIDSFIRVLAALDLRLEIMPKLIEPEQAN